MAIRSQVNARIQVPGISVAQVDYRWPRGTEILDRHPAHVLRRRAAPSRLNIAALVDNRRIPFGHLMFFPAERPVRTAVAELDERADVTVCQFNPDWFAKTIDYDRDWSVDDMEALLDIQNSRVDQAMQWMGMELAAPGFASNLVIESLSSFIALELARNLLRDEGRFRIRTRDGKLLPAHLRRIVEYIENIEGKCPTIEEMATSCGISAAHLRRASGFAYVSIHAAVAVASG